MLWPPTRPRNDLFQPSVRRSSFSRKWRSTRGSGTLEDGRLGGGCDTFQNFLKKRFSCLAIGVGVEVQDDAVAQYAWRDSGDIVDAQMHAPAHERQYTPALDQ